MKIFRFFYPLDSFKNLKESSEQIEIPKLFERGSRLDWLHRRCDRFHYPLCHESEPDSTVHFNTHIFGSENTIGFEETFFENQQDIDLFKLIDFESLKKNFTTLKDKKIEISIEKHYNLYNVPIETSILKWDAFDRRFNIDQIDFLLSSFY
ncbi:MAG: hypothetical protein HC836_47905 [Richelia sp. RM2_1_2]|nr:hypothetical protein [Richelia sp. RM2_1_2]